MISELFQPGFDVATLKDPTTKEEENWVSLDEFLAFVLFLAFTFALFVFFGSH
jgi:hypothetical protein